MNGLPLSGVRITDLTHYWTGPHATRILADLGADVIKVEYPARLCVLRGAFREGKAYDRHPRWYQVNRNKRTITLDLKEEREREILRDLVGVSDVVAENSRPGVMSNLGLGYEDLRKLKPDLIMLSLSACGSSGPWAHYAGVGGSLEPLSGLQELTAYHQDGKRMRIKEADVISGVFGACAIMTALIHRQRTGRGQWIDASQLEILAHTMVGEHMLEYVMNGTHTLPLGNRHARFAPQGCYRCQGEDKWVVLTIRSDEEWEALCEVVGQPSWKQDPRFGTVEDRRKNHDDLDRLIEGWTRSRGHEEVMRLLQARGIPAGAVLNTAELIKDPHLQARGYFKPATDGTNGLFPGLPGARPEWGSLVRRRGPDLGAHNESVVRGLLGRPKQDVPTINEDEIGTGFDPE